MELNNLISFAVIYIVMNKFTWCFAIPLHNPQPLSGTGRQIFVDYNLDPNYNFNPIHDNLMQYEPEIATVKESEVNMGSSMGFLEEPPQIQPTLSPKKARATKAFAPRTWQDGTKPAKQLTFADEVNAKLVKLAEDAVVDFLTRAKRFLTVFAR